MRGIAAVVLIAGCSFQHGAASADAQSSGDDDAPVIIDDAPPDVALPATCSDGVINGSETDVDCGGGVCGQCAIDKMCTASSDCLLSVCGSSTFVCRYARSCKELHNERPELGDAAYQIDPDGSGVNSSTAFGTYCDMTTDGGGWTLAGKVDGRFDMYATWLVSTVNPTDMLTPTIGTNTYASIDAVTLAVDRSTEIRFSNSARTRWVKWPLPASRATGTFWHHVVGHTTINAAPQPTVTATAWDGTTSTCNQNEYDVLPLDVHGGAYPALGRNAAGNTLGNDLCMAIGTQTTATAIDGFTSNGNGFDAPADETTWPNTAYNVTPHVAVWLR